MSISVNSNRPDLIPESKNIEDNIRGLLIHQQPHRFQQRRLADAVIADDQVEALQSFDLEVAELAEVLDMQAGQHGGRPGLRMPASMAPRRPPVKPTGKK
ncbi:hypothetical protein A6A05_05815 [Magnetospirillum moscoviense]|uniref:Uncharacterized protein n=1 Tax=Magnetospirillum moscoviense TaxID=1437059 RepID=A0A178MZN5_9PROT|nr:hypothetical protein A6A05_05815 [Magnetospirillum moscoviense]